MEHIKFSALFVENELKSVGVLDPGFCDNSKILCGMFCLVCS